jgi:hypothetical protein
VVIQSYRHRFGLVPGDPAYADIERRLAAQPAITVPTITFDGATTACAAGAAAAHARASPARVRTASCRASATTCRRKRRGCSRRRCWNLASARMHLLRRGLA